MTNDQTDNLSPRIIISRGSTLLRNLDFYIGIPIIFMCSVFKKYLKKKSLFDFPSKGFKNICLIKTAAIGDSVQLLAIVDELIRSNSKVEISIYCGQSNIEFVQLMPNVKEVVLLPVTNPFKSFKILKRKKFEIVVDFGSWPRIDAIYASVIPSEYCIGFKTIKEYRHYSFDAVVEHNSLIHEFSNYCNLMSLLGLNFQTLTIPKLELNNDKSNFFESLPFKPHEFVIAHLWAGGSQKDSKSWSEINWIKIFKKIHNEYNLPIVLTGSISDYEKNEILINKNLCCGVLFFNAAGFELNKTLVLLKFAKLVITIDTSILHLSSALGVNLIALHGPTHSKRWGALSESSISINAIENAVDAPISLGFEKSNSNLMDTITVDMVWNSVNCFMKGK